MDASGDAGRAGLASALIVGGALGCGGSLCAAAVVLLAVDPTWQAMIPCAGVAAFLSGTGLWWFLVSRGPHGRSRRRHLVAGAAAGLLAHPIAWYLVLLVHYFTSAADSPA